jgi:HTH-type transcriptional regulator/antitoxin HigA
MHMSILSIDNDTGYQAALKQASTYVDREPELGTNDAEHFLILLDLIQAWEARHFPLVSTP